MSSYPYIHGSKFVELLQSQQNISFDNYALSSSQPMFQSIQGTENVRETTTDRRERRKWTLTDDIVLISSWLNTSKYPVVNNEQKSNTFWTRVASYFAASPQVASCEHREGAHCKQRWHKINNLVCKFCGAYEAATGEKTSGQNDNNILKLAHHIFYNNYKKKFTLEHVWKELRNDQKWCERATAKNEGMSKKRRCDHGVDSSSSKAAKAHGKKTLAEENAKEELENLSSLREKDFAMKEKLTKLNLLDRFMEKKKDTETEEHSSRR